MASTHHDLFTSLLALSLLAVGSVPLATAGQPAPDDHHKGACDVPGTFEGWLWGANPSGEEFLVSQIGYQLVEDGHIGEYVNGVDAYVVDLGCRLTSGQSMPYCIQRIAPETEDELLTFKVLFTERQDDLAVSHFDSGWGLVETHNPEGTSDFCDRIPGTTRYAVVWTTSDVPRGVQTSTASGYLPPDTSGNQGSTPPGPFTLKFCLEAGIDAQDCPPAIE